MDVTKLSSATEIKHALRKIEFPECAKEALQKIEQLLVEKIGSLKHLNLAIDLMSEFVFAEMDRRGNKKTANFTSLEELQLLKIFCEYFSGSATEQTKNTMFLSLFPPSNILLLRMKILCKLVSMAICIPTPAVLHAAGIWMQQLGTIAPTSLRVANSIVNDYFVFTPSAVSRLRALPATAPVFTANFLTAVAELYLSEEPYTFTPPPTVLLETVTQWVVDNPNLCTAAQNSVPALPVGAIQMSAITPIAGLMRWCILQPIHFAIIEYKCNTQIIKNAKTQLEDMENTKEFYAKLHNAIMATLNSLKPGITSPNVICALHLTNIVPALDLQIKELTAMGKNIRVEPSVEIAMYRLSHVVQTVLTTKCIYGNVKEFLKQVESLPDLFLLKVIIDIHKDNLL